MNMASVRQVNNMLGNDKDVKKQQKVMGFWQTMFPTSCIQGPAELGLPCLVFNYF